MHYKILCMLLLIKSLKIDARGRIPIPKATKNSNEVTTSVVNTTESINLPQGFNPESSPMYPLLYPFVTESTVNGAPGITSGWQPIFLNRTAIGTTTVKSILQDLSVSPSKEIQEELRSEEGPVWESIVYGSWKSEPPIQPKLQGDIDSTDNPIKNRASISSEDVLRRRLGDFIEEVERRKPIKDSFEISASIESNEQALNAKGRAQKKYGRRKIPNFNAKAANETLKPPYNSSMSVIKVNSTDPELMNIIKQINDSVETPSTIKSKSKEILPNKDSFASKSPDSNNKTPKEWPIDFINSNEGSEAAQEISTQENIFNFVGDSSEPPRSIGSVNFDESLTSSTSINITKMGIPYEDQNSSEEASICVSLAVRERSVSNPNEIVDVERVYCFPLPQDTKHNNKSETLNLDKDDLFSVLSYEELSTSRGAYLKAAIWLVSLRMLFI